MPGDRNTDVKGWHGGNAKGAPLSTVPQFLSFDVFGTLVSVRDSSYGAFRSILHDCGGGNLDVAHFWEFWEERNIVHYWEPYRTYKEICEISLAETFANFRLHGRPSLIERYFEAFRDFQLYPDVQQTLDILGRKYRLGIVSNIDDDLLEATPLAAASTLCVQQSELGSGPFTRLDAV